MISLKKFLLYISCPYRVGDICITTDSNPPSTTWPWTKWELFSEGKTLVGLDSQDPDFATVGQEGGVKGAWYHNHTEPTHVHSTGFRISSGSGGSATVPAWVNSSGKNYTNIYTDSVSAKGLTYSGSTNNQQDAGKANLQPYIVTYMWRRVASNTWEKVSASTWGEIEQINWNEVLIR